MSSLLFDDVFKVSEVDPGQYDRVVRLTASSTTASDMELTLDVNSELFPVSVGETITVAVAQTLSLDGDDTEAAAGWRRPRPDERTLADDYDYVMHGVVYKFDESTGDKVAVYVSFGGLLMCLEGDYRSLSGLKLDNIYLLVRR